MAATIRVSDQLRDRINREAHERGLTATGLIEGLLDGYERRKRLESFGRALRGADKAYWDEFALWDIAFRESRVGG